MSVSRCSNHASTQASPHGATCILASRLCTLCEGELGPEQNIMDERCSVIVLSTIAQQPGGSIEDRLQTIQKVFRRTNQQTVTAIDLRCNKGGNSRSRCLERQRLDAAFK